eukprot:9487379-Pyramimonas_sp.AAC.1
MAACLKATVACNGGPGRRTGSDSSGPKFMKRLLILSGSDAAVSGRSQESGNPVTRIVRDGCMISSRSSSEPPALSKLVPLRKAATPRLFSCRAEAGAGAAVTGSLSSPCL